MNSQSKILITGASGFLGSYVLDALHSMDVDVLAISRKPLSISARNINIDLLSFSDLTSILKVERPTHLLHLAWETEHGKYWNSPLNLRWVEVTVRLVEAFCLNGGEKVVIAGTSAEYDWTYGYMREDYTPLKSSSLYGSSKEATRLLVKSICLHHQIPFCWARLFLPYGRGESPSRLIPSLFQVFSGNRDPFSVNTSCYRDFLHASDLASGLVRLLSSNAYGEYNVSSGIPTMLYDLILLVANLTQSDPDLMLSRSVNRTGESSIVVGDNLKLKSLGWSPVMKLPEALKIISEHYLRTS